MASSSTPGAVVRNQCPAIKAESRQLLPLPTACCPLGAVLLLGILLWGPRRERLSGLPAASPDSFPGNWAPAFWAR